MVEEPNANAAERSQRELSGEFGDKIRDAAKWLVGSFAAVGAALIAGSQLSNIGKLSVCGELSLECTRIWWAIGGAAIGLAGVTWAIWTAVGLLTPLLLPASAFQKEWRKGAKSPVVVFFQENKSYLQGFKDFDDMQKQEDDAYNAFDDASNALNDAPPSRQAAVEEQLDAADVELQDLLARSEAVLSIANQVAFTHFFRRDALKRILLASVVAAIGIGTFAWAGNPPSTSELTASMRGADLSGADLSGANLRSVDMREANLTNANLTGADLSDASLVDARLEGVVWSRTTCPDGKTSDQVGGSCINHLRTSAEDS